MSSPGGLGEPSHELRHRQPAALDVAHPDHAEQDRLPHTLVGMNERVVLIAQQDQVRRIVRATARSVLNMVDLLAASATEAAHLPVTGTDVASNVQRKRRLPRS